MKYTLILILIFCGFFGCNVPKSDKEQTKNGVGWREFTGLDNLKMNGIVTYINKDIGNGYHGRGIIRINVLNSNIKFYNPKNKQSNYYCIIKDNEAEIYDNNVSDINIGDTINIDTKEQVINWIDNHGKHYEYSISIGEPDFFTFISKNNLQRF